MTAVPTVNTSPKVPMNSVTYLRIATPTRHLWLGPWACDHSEAGSEDHLKPGLIIRHDHFHRPRAAGGHHIGDHQRERVKLWPPPPDDQPPGIGLLGHPGLGLRLPDRPDGGRR